MARQVIDILPVKKPKLKPKVKVKTSSFFLIFVFGLFIFGLFFGLKFSKAEIELLPKIELKNFEDKIFVFAGIKEINFQKKQIPGKIFEFEKEIEKKFPATGKSLKKAEGKIILYNSYTTQDETWKAQTRFVSSEGKVFLSKDKIFVPGAKIKDGKLIPSSVEVPVIAAEGGSEYNIGPSKFAIPAFKGTERYFKYYGESKEPMKGGGEIKVVSAEDLIEGAKKLTKEIEEGKIEIQVPEGFILPKNSISVEILEKSSDKKEGQEAEEFLIKAKLKIKILGIEKKFLRSFLEREFYSKLKKKILFTKEKIETELGAKDFQEGKFLLNLKVSVEVLPEFDLQEIKKKIAGKSLKEAQEKLKEEEIERAKIKLFPFWSFQIPENLERIEIKVREVD